MTASSGSPGGPRTMKASEFKARCLQLMDEIASGGDEIIITKHGAPVARLAAYREKPKTFFANDAERYPFIQEVIDALDRGEGADVAFERIETAAVTEDASRN